MLILTVYLEGSELMWLLKSIQGGLVWSAGVDVAFKLFDRLLYFFCDKKIRSNLNSLFFPKPVTPNAYFNLQELR
jgi:hypothetical protein